MLEGDLCLQFPGEFFGKLSRQPVLPTRRFNKNDGSYDQQKNYQQKAPEYFQEYLQGQAFKYM
jgi:hypothetical protein